MPLTQMNRAHTHGFDFIASIASFILADCCDAICTETTGSARLWALLWVAKPLQQQTTNRNALACFARFCGAHRRGRSSSGFNAIDKWCAHKTFIISICLAAIVGGGVAVVVFRPPLVSLDAKTILTWHYNLVYKYNFAIFALHSAAAGAWWWWWFWSSLAVCACACAKWRPAYSVSLNTWDTLEQKTHPNLLNLLNVRF